MFKYLEIEIVMVYFLAHVMFLWLFIVKLKNLEGCQKYNLVVLCSDNKV